VFDSLIIQSHKGPYTVSFDAHFSAEILLERDAETHFLVDSNVARLYGPRLRAIISRSSTVVINATEDNKSLEKIIPIFELLIASKVRRGHVLVAIGGGIIQDITCFVASTFLRGLHWHFVPTTLLAQADSCIGSKSSINLGPTKNIIGTFNPPQQVYICTEFLDTLDQKDIRSGLGEIIKVHAIEGVKSFDRMSKEFRKLGSEREVQLRYIQSALVIKKRFIEEDEFDKGIRNLFNYGHSFGHAIESATNYRLPHGIAVSIGMDMANFIAHVRGLLPRSHFDRMHETLRMNYEEYSNTEIALDAFIDAIMKDKKNTTAMLGLILPVGDNAAIQRVNVKPDTVFRDECARFLLDFKQ
jgi:3-dehydroquinate synthase